MHLIVFTLLLGFANSQAAKTQDDQERTHLMVVGGTTSDTRYDVEVIDLSNNAVPCYKPPDYPEDAYTTVGTTLGGVPVVCGGLHTDLCYRLVDGAWEVAPFGVQNERTRFLYAADSVEMYEDSWLIAGGFGGRIGFEDFITEVHPGAGNSEPYEIPLPKRLADHNLLKINDTHLFLVNGDVRSRANVWMYEIGSLEWIQMPEMALARDDALAGVVTRSDGRKEIVVTTGQVVNHRTEIFDLDTLTWRAGTNFPVSMTGGSSVPYGSSTFLAVGGHTGTGGSPLDKIWKYHPDEETWEELPQRMQRGRSEFAAFLVSDGYC